MDELPVAANPARGWLATANEMTLPEDFPAYDKVISFDWYAPSRAERLAEVFGDQRRFSPENCVRLQSDFVSVPARRIVRRLAEVQILRSSLREAVADTEQLLGPNHEQRAWGRLHVSRLVHPLSPLFNQPTRDRLAVGPVERDGSGDTVGNTAYTPNFVQSGGSTFRIVIDVGNWDGSLVMNSPGQSGDPDSPHYADLFERWGAGEAFPLLYSRDAVEAATERRIHLRPPGPH